MSTRIALNGFGRIGRSVVRALHERAEAGINLVAVNDLTPIETAAYLMQYDSVHGQMKQTVSTRNGFLNIGEKKVHYVNIPDPEKLPWKDLDIDIVLECTGVFTSRAKSLAHVNAGATRVLISGPCDDADLTVVDGVNDGEIDRSNRIFSNASCTTNCLGLLAKVLHDNIGIEGGLMSSVHAYTADQSLVDMPHKDLRRSRAAAVSIIPTTTGAARALKFVLPELKGKVDGMAIRVPTPNVSLVEFTVLCKRPTSVAEVNQMFVSYAESTLANVLAYSDKPLVSVDYNHRPESAIVDLTQTQVVCDRLVKVAAWYDNEWGFANRMLDVSLKIAQSANHPSNDTKETS